VKRNLLILFIGLFVISAVSPVCFAGGLLPSGGTLGPDTKIQDPNTSLVEVYDLEAGYYDSPFTKQVPGVRFKIRNNSDRLLSLVEVTILFKDGLGSIVHSESFRPIAAEYVAYNKPLNTIKPGAVWQLEPGKYFEVHQPRPEWNTGSIEAKVDRVNFAN